MSVICTYSLLSIPLKYVEVGVSMFPSLISEGGVANHMLHSRLTLQIRICISFLVKRIEIVSGTGNPAKMTTLQQNQLLNGKGTAFSGIEVQ